jgi:hypothetical protein
MVLFIDFYFILFLFLSFYFLIELKLASIVSKCGLEFPPDSLENLLTGFLSRESVVKEKEFWSLRISAPTRCATNSLSFLASVVFPLSIITHRTFK